MKLLLRSFAVAVLAASLAALARRLQRRHRAPERAAAAARAAAAVKPQRGEPEGPREAPRRARRRLLRARPDGRRARGADRSHEARPRQSPTSTTSTGSSTRCCGENAKAEQNFQRALQLAPQDSDIRHNWGWYLCTHGRARESIAEFELAVRNPLYRTPEIALVNAGRCSASFGDTAGAEAYFKRALAIAPGNPDAAYGLALIAYRAAATTRRAAGCGPWCCRRRPAPRRSISACASSASAATGRPRCRTSSQLRNRYPDSRGDASAVRRGPASDRVATSRRAATRGAAPAPASGRRAAARGARGRRAVDRRGRATAEARAASGAGARGGRLRAAARAARSCAASCATTRGSCGSTPDGGPGRAAGGARRRRSTRRRCTPTAPTIGELPTAEPARARLDALGDPADARRDHRRDRRRTNGCARRREPRAARQGAPAPPSARPRASARRGRSARHCPNPSRRRPPAAPRREPAAAAVAGAGSRAGAGGSRPRRRRRRLRHRRRRARRSPRPPLDARVPRLLVDRGARIAPARAAVADEPRRHDAGARRHAAARRRDRQRCRRDASPGEGQRVDLAPYTRQNVARFTLRMTAARDERSALASNATHAAASTSPASRSAAARRSSCSR